MTVWPPEDQQRVARDLTQFFNAMSRVRVQKQDAPDFKFKKEDLTEINYQITGEMAMIVDFRVKDARLFASTIRRNTLNSNELTAIEIIRYLNQTGRYVEVVPVLYDVMNEVIQINNLDITPAQKLGR